jgi:hypothetical protein
LVHNIHIFRTLLSTCINIDHRALETRSAFLSDEVKFDEVNYEWGLKVVEKLESEMNQCGCSLGAARGWLPAVWGLGAGSSARRRYSLLTVLPSPDQG